MAKNDNDFSVVLNDQGSLVGSPVQRAMESPLSVLAQSISGGVDAFKRSMDQRDVDRAKRKKAQQEATDTAGGNAIFDGLLARERAKQGRTDTSATTSIPGGIRQIATQEGPVVPEGMSFEEAFSGDFTSKPLEISPDTVINGAIQDGTTTTEEVEAVSSMVADGTERLRTVNAGIAQGVMPGITADTTAEEIVSSVLARHPSMDRKVVGAILESAGIKNTFMAATKNEFEDRQAITDSRRAAVADAYKEGLAVLGPQVVGEIPDAQIAAAGALSLKQKAQLAMLKTQADIQATQASTAQSVNTLAETAVNKEIYSTSISALQTTLAPISNTIQKLLVAAGERGLNPVEEEELQRLRNISTQVTANFINNQSLEIARVSGSAAAENFRKQAEAYVSTSVTNLFDNRDKTFVRIRENIVNNLKLDSIVAGNGLMLMKELGINLIESDVLIQNLNDEQREAFSALFQNLPGYDITSISGRDRASLYIAEVMEVVKGDRRLSDVTPANASQAYRTIRDINSVYSKEIISGDTTNSARFLDNQLDIARLAVKVTSTSPAQTLANALRDLTGRGSGPNNNSNFVALDRLIKTGDEEAELAGRGTRAAVAQNMMALRNKGDLRDDYHEVVYNQQKGVWEVKRDDAGLNKLALQGSRGGIVLTARDMPIPSGLLAISEALNRGTTFLAKSAGWDENAPQGNTKELMDYYATGRATPAMRRQAEQMAKRVKDAKDGPKEAGSLLRQLQGAVEDLQTRGIRLNESSSFENKAGDTVEIKTPAEIRQRLSGNPVLSQIEAGAAAVGIPPDLAVTLIGGGENRSLDNSAKASDGKGGFAYGIMQVHDTSWDATTLKRYGKRVKDLTPAENIEMGLWILKQNYDKTGSWRDAVSMYHSGRPFNKLSATTGDVNVNTRDYVGAIMNASGVAG